MMCLGYKEFHKYLNASTPSKQDFDNAINNMKVATRKYAKRQVYWIRNKLLPTAYLMNNDEASTTIYLLDATGELTIALFSVHVRMYIFGRARGQVDIKCEKSCGEDHSRWQPFKLTLKLVLIYSLRFSGPS
jgi:hypothetical protein